MNPAVWCNRIEELQAENTQLKELLGRLLEHGDNTEATDLPFWIIASRPGAAFSGSMVLHSGGIWFSREAATQHFNAKRHRYPKNAMVWCASAHGSPGGLGGLLRATKAALKQADNKPPTSG